MDEHESSHERRGKFRRTHDVEDITEVRLLRHEIKSLQEKLEQEEAEDHRRLIALEEEVAEFRRKFNVGKGIFYGSVAVLGTTGVYVVDSMKDAIEKLMK